jgi:hypothetical protein
MFSVVKGRNARRTIGSDKQWGAIIGTRWKRGDGKGVDAVCGCVVACSEKKWNW